MHSHGPTILPGQPPVWEVDSIAPDLGRFRKRIALREASSRAFRCIDTTSTPETHQKRTKRVHFGSVALQRDVVGFGRPQPTPAPARSAQSSPTWARARVFRIQRLLGLQLPTCWPLPPFHGSISHRGRLRTAYFVCASTCRAALPCQGRRRLRPPEPRRKTAGRRFDAGQPCG